MIEKSIFRAIVAKRGIEDLDIYLHPKYESLFDPCLLPDMNRAVTRIKKAHSQEEVIGIYGDYDLDGLTAAVLLHEGMNLLGIESEIFIPDRFIDGYGLSRRGIDYFQEKGIKLIITVDCGSRSTEEIAYAKELGVDMIVTDHHETDVLPAALAVINPRRRDSHYLTRSLAGVGVTFKLLRALQQKLPGIAEGQEKWLLDLVALGTIGDVVELTQENRVLAYWGLKVLAKTRRAGLKFLLEQAGSDRPVDENLISYYLAPRLNAAGRLQGARAALELLTAQDEQQAELSAATLEKFNEQRRSDQEKIYAEALEQAIGKPDQAVLVLADKDWSHGINGIVASKLAEKLHKPVFVFQDMGDGTLKGSGRSQPGFDLSAALDAVRSLLISGGGHRFAAGATLSKDNLEKFEAKLQQLFATGEEQPLRPDQLNDCDYRSEKLDGFSSRLVEMIDGLRPFGPGNEQPVFLLSDMRLTEARAVGSEGYHLKGHISDKSGRHLPFIAFQLGKMTLPSADQLIGVLGHLENNDFRGQRQVELRIIRFIS